VLRRSPGEDQLAAPRDRLVHREWVEGDAQKGKGR
jgi:hypothetical protein